MLRQLRHPDGLPDEQLGAALAYLEVAWLEATRLAAETDAACADLEEATTTPQRPCRPGPAATTRPCAPCARPSPGMSRH